jgi:hypothetical protein
MFQNKYYRLLSFMLNATLLLTPVCSAQAQSAASERITDAIRKHFPEPTSIVILPTQNGYLDESEESEAETEEAAAQLRRLGYSVRTMSQGNVARTVNRTIGRSNAIGRASIGRLGTSLGVGAIILFALATARENEMSVTTSIYASNRGVFEQISRSTSRWNRDNRGVGSSRPGVSRCTQNLLVNGNFEEDWERGWTRSYSDIEQGSSITEVVRVANNNVLHIKHVGRSDVSLHQIVAVPKGRIFFGFETKFVAREGPIGGFSGTGTAGINVIFLDANKNALGLLWAGSFKRNPFEDTGLVGVPQSPESNNSASFITIPNNRAVTERLEVSKIARDRLGKLDLNKVRYVAINISVGATHRRASAEAWVDNLSLEVCP